MDELQRLELRKEIKLYLEEERREKEKEELILVEKEFKMLSYLVILTSLVLGVVLTFMSDEKLTYLLYFLLSFSVASLISFFTNKSKLHPKEKSVLFMFSALIYIFGILIPFFLFKEGII